MKFNININQKAVIDLGLDLDLQDLAILDFMRCFSQYPKCERIQYDNFVYFWFSHKIIIEELPILGIKTRQGINKKIEKLISAGMIIRYDNNQASRKSYFRFGENFSKLDFYVKEDYLPTSNKSYPTEKEEQQKLPTSNKSYTSLATKVTPTSNKSLHYNNNKDNNTSNNSVTPRNEIACEQTSLFPKGESVKEKKTLFRNSVIGKWNIEELDAYFSKDEFTAKIDWGFYKITVSDWSDSADKKRTKRGWIATMHQFVRDAKEKNKLKLKPQYQNKENNKLCGYTYAEIIDPLKGLK